jgi:hypothetical protein
MFVPPPQASQKSLDSQTSRKTLIQPNFNNVFHP